MLKKLFIICLLFFCLVITLHQAFALGWSSESYFPANKTHYHPDKKYQFNVTWISSGTITVKIEHNFTGSFSNYSVTGNASNTYYYNYTGLSGGYYAWRMHANDSLGSVNSTDWFYYFVNDSCQPPSSGNWILNLSNSVKCYSKTLTLTNGSLYMHDNSQLIMDNVNLSYQGAGAGASVYLQDNSRINITNAYFNTNNIIGFYVENNASARLVNITTRFLTFRDSANLTLIDSNITYSFQIEATNENDLNIHDLASYSINTQYFTNNINFINITNTDIEYAYLIAKDNTHCKASNLSIYYISTSDNSSLNLSDSNITTLEIFGNGTNYIQNSTINEAEFFAYSSSIIIGSRFTYFKIYGDSNAAFKELKSNLTRFSILKGEEDLRGNHSKVEGNFTIINKTYTFSENITFTRIYPTKIVWSNQSLFTALSNINITRKNKTIFTGSTSSGIIDLNISFNWTNYMDKIKVYINNLSLWNLTLLNDTPLSLVYDNSNPLINYSNPLNHSFHKSSTVSINLTTDDSCTCQYRLNNGNYLIFSSTYKKNHSFPLTSLSDGTYNLSINCTNQYNLHTIAITNFTVDTINPEVNISYPLTNIIVSNSVVEINFSADDSYLDSFWYKLNYNQSISTINQTIVNISFYGGRQYLVVYANDTAGNVGNSTVSFYINQSLDLSKWSSDYGATQEFSTIEVFNSSGSKLSGNNSILQEFSLEMNFSDITVNIFNFSGINTTWYYYFAAEDNSSSFENIIQNNYGTNPVDYVYLRNFSKFFSYSNQYYGRVRLPKGRGNYTNIYYCANQDLSNCNVLSTCSGSFGKTTSSACYASAGANIDVYVPHFSAVFGDNDTIAPQINIISPENNSVINKSYQISLVFNTSESATCYYKKNTGSYSLVTGTTSHSTTFKNYSNSQLNLTINCSDSINERISVISVTVNDTTSPVISVTETVDVDDVELAFTLNEPSNYTVIFEGESDETHSGWITSADEDYYSLDDGDYDYTIIACDQLGNCGNVTGDVSVDTSSSDSSSSSSSSSTSSTSSTTSSSSAANQIWISPEQGSYTMSISSTNIAFTSIEFDLKYDISGTVLLSVQSTQLPTNIPSLEGEVFQYIKIIQSVITDMDIEDVKLKFRIDKDWIVDNNIDPGTITLYRYTTKWSALATTEKSHDSSYYYYEAETPGFSYFAIKGEVAQVAESNATQEQNASEKTGGVTGQAINEVSGQEPQPDTTTTKKSTNLKLLLFIPFVVFAVIIAGAIGFILYQRNMSVVSDAELNDLKKYVEKCKSEGIAFESIKKTLLAAGWKEYLVDLVMHDVHIPSSDVNRIKEYIVKAKKRGKGNDQIRENLLKVGWQEEVINEAFNQLKKSTSASQHHQ